MVGYMALYDTGSGKVRLDSTSIQRDDMRSGTTTISIQPGESKVFDYSLPVPAELLNAAGFYQVHLLTYVESKMGGAVQAIPSNDVLVQMKPCEPSPK
jgi:hypothetical protein